MSFAVEQGRTGVPFPEREEITMTIVVADISMSLDGFVTGPNAGPKNGLGDGGEPIHAWVFSGDPVNEAFLADATERSGAVVMGRNLFDVVDGPDGWNDEMGYGAGRAGRPLFFVVTHQRPASVRLDLDFTFVTGGVAAAIGAARAACPAGKDVVIMGGGDVVRQAIDRGVIDQLRIHLSPIVMGSGTPLFGAIGRRQFRQTDVQVSADAVHLTYEAVSTT
jgi:dihydrofolate reductase